MNGKKVKKSAFSAEGEKILGAKGVRRTTVASNIFSESFDSGVKTYSHYYSSFLSCIKNICTGVCQEDDKYA